MFCFIEILCNNNLVQFLCTINQSSLRIFFKVLNILRFPREHFGFLADVQIHLLSDFDGTKYVICFGIQLCEL